MNALIIITAIALCVLQIIIIVKFFQMSSDVAALKKHFCDPVSEADPVSKLTVEEVKEVNLESPINIGETVLRVRDGAEMIVERSNAGSYACLNAKDRSWMGIYSRKEITKKSDKPIALPK